ncbi:MAG: hypothetical protein C0482_10080 [Gordonia sp.]|nr:hypothetical protein [Gordonia sp. (in: high G+C Gram-positive bacteria)]
MTYVIAQGCCNDASCISVCPVDCIRPRPEDPEFMSAEQLYIDPDACIDCAACMWECPVGAIYDEFDVPEHLDVFKEINAEYFAEHPLEVRDSVKKARRKLPADKPGLRVAVVGSGPSGCYAVDQLSSVAGVEVSVFDRLPTPFGLARSGVAPDHLATKDVTKFFGKVLRRPNVSCYFNVEVGKDVSLEELAAHHHAVVLAVGADTDRALGIEGEDLSGSASAREFVSWYNGHPDHGAREFDLAGQRVVIIGNGNVALDAARLLVSDPDELESSDMAQHALDLLRDSSVREVVVAARRGILDAAYTTSELMALSRLEGVDLVARPDEVATGDDSRLDRAQVRRKHAVAAAASPADGATADRRITLRYGLTPQSINGDGQVESVTFRRTGADPSGADPSGTDTTETIEAGLVLRAIGYRSSPIVGVPFDERTGTIAHDNGRVRDQTGLYCVGWAKRGPTGVIGTNQVCATETVAELFADFAHGLFTEPETSADELSALISSRNPAVVDFSGWQDIDAAERARGESVSRPRVKFISIDEMLAAVRA